MSEEVKQEEVPQSSNSILNAFKQEFSTSVNNVYVNSLQKEVQFKEVTVKEQKTLSKTMIENEQRKDIVYDTQCALINRLSLVEGFDIYNLTEFDRVRILMEIYQQNYFQNDIHFKCKECGCENSYKFDFGRVLSKFNAFDLNDITFTAEDSNRTYNFKLNYPNVKNVSIFYHQYMKKYKNITQKERDVLDSLGNIEYINLFIKEIEIVNKQTQQKTIADLTILSYSQIEELLSMFPQNILFSDETGVLKYIQSEFIDKLNSVFNYEKCAHCGAEAEEGMGNIIDFF